MRELGRITQGLRRKVKKRCPQCGTEFEGIVTKVYCSRRCVARAFWYRHHDEVLRRKREAYRRRKGQQQEGEP